MQTSYAIKVGTTDSYVSVIYANDFNLTTSFDEAVQCTTQTEATNLLSLISAMTELTCVVVRRDVEYTTISNNQNHE